MQQALEAPADENEQQQPCEPQQQPGHIGPHAAAAEQHAAAAGQTAAATEATANENVDADEEMNESRKRGKANVDDGERPHKVEKTTDEASNSRIDAVRSRSPMTRDDRALAFQSYNMSRQLDGLPTVQQDDPAFHRFLEATSPLEPDEELMAEAFSEKNLTAEEKKAFDEAKDAALMVWIENAAWRAVPESEAKMDEVVPARFLQRWKPIGDGNHKANARVIIQGFKHRDVLNENLLKESPTLSRMGRMVIMTWGVHRRWKLWCADVKVSIYAVEFYRRGQLHLRQTSRRDAEKTGTPDGLERR